MKQQLWEICRDKKDSINPRITNQQLAAQSGLSQNAVGQFLRGESPNAPLSTFGPICKILGISVDEYLGIESHSATAQDTAMAERLASAEKLNEVYSQELQRKTTLIVFLLLLVLAALTALIIDISNPNVGWIRDTMSAIAAFPYS